MSSLSQRIEEAPGVRFAGLRQAGGQHGVRHLTGTLADGRQVGGYVSRLAQAAQAALTG